jgi:hypothetical protein
MAAEEDRRQADASTSSTTARSGTSLPLAGTTLTGGA